MRSYYSDRYLRGDLRFFLRSHTQKPQIVTASLPAAVQGVPYAHQLVASGGIEPYVWSEWVEEPSYDHAVQTTSSFAATGVALGVVLTAIDFAAGLPWWWGASEGAFTVIYFGAMWWLSSRIGEKPAE